ncbi:MAG TPA: site-specific integrase [Planctomycetaceae bacterium]|jgi:integrase
MQAMETKRRKTARRGNGEGSIYQRGDGRWVASVVVGRDQTGKQRRKVVYGWTKADVTGKLSKLLPQALDGTLGTHERLTVGAYLDKWMEDTVKANRKPSTFARYETSCNLHIKPLIGGIQLSKLTPVQLRGLYASLQRDGHSLATCEITHAILHSAFKSALKSDLVTRNVCDCVDRPKAPDAEIKTIDAAQVNMLLESIRNDRLYALYLLAIDSGMRQGEMLALRWDDISFESRTISVRRKVIEVKKVFHVDEPKTASGRRSITVTPATIEALREHQAKMLAEGLIGGGWVFPRRNGKFIRRNWLVLRIKKILADAGLPEITFHALRHTCATMLLQASTHGKIVQERLGHSKIAITLDTYSHVTPTMQQQAADVMGGLLAKAGA